MPQKTRFEVELEFVQLLCNPDYLKWLFNEGYFDDAAFKNLLEYLKYWKEPKYKKYLLYPQALVMLDSLTSSNVKELLNSEQFLAKLSDTQYHLWLNQHED